MFKKAMFLFALFAFTCAIVSVSFAQEAETTVISGEVKEVAEDGTSVMVGDQKIMTTPELVEDLYLEPGDMVEVTVEKTEQGLKATAVDFVLEEEEDVEMEE